MRTCFAKNPGAFVSLKMIKNGLYFGPLCSRAILEGPIPTYPVTKWVQNGSKNDPKFGVIFEHQN